MQEPNYVDPTGEGMHMPNPRLGTIYNGTKQCACGELITPVQALTSDECPKCKRHAAMRRLNNRMVD